MTDIEKLMKKSKEIDKINKKEKELKPHLEALKDAKQMLPKLFGELIVSLPYNNTTNQWLELIEILQDFVVNNLKELQAVSKIHNKYKQGDK